MKKVSITHTPFADGKFQGLVDSIRNSPYPWHYTMRWPWYFNYPSTRNHSGISPKPDIFKISEFDTKPASDYIRLTFAGDIMVLNGDKPPILCNELNELIHNSDLFIANLEAPLGSHKPDKNKRYTFRFHMPFSFLDAIQKQTGLDYSRWILTNANNHSGDAGLRGFNESISLLDSLGVMHLGHRDFTNPFRIVEHGNFKFAFSGWTHWLNRDMYSKQQPVISEQDINNSTPKDFKRKNDIDFIIGLPHWEYEFQHFPRKKTRQLASSYIDKGFDLLVGSHPHVLQPYELFNKKACFYSLGNFCGLGIAKSVKIISLLEVYISRPKANIEAQMSYFKIHYFYQLHNERNIEIIPLYKTPQHLLTPALKRLSKIVEFQNINNPFQ